jgi:protein-tyrosine phosphatase
MIGSPALVDVHNHLIPGVDDGARDLEEALEATGEMYEQGVRRIVMTPHLDADLIRRGKIFERRMAQMDEAWESIRSAVAIRFPDLEVARGHEIMLDVPQLQLDDPRLRLAGGPAVLIEFPRFFMAPAVTDVLYNVRLSGRLPVIAHPERYVSIDSSFGLIEDWRRVGARMAVNAGSLLGGFGPKARATTREMLRRGWIDLLGSDYHARAVRRPLLLRQTFEELVDAGGEDQAHLLMSINPGRVMDGQDPYEVPPLALREGVWDRIRRMLGR